MGKKTLFLARSPTFTGFIRNNTKDDEFEVISVNELDDLIKQRSVFDSLIMDEGQDLCEFSAIDKIELILKGGLEKGRWRWFGDHNNQISPTIDYDATAYNYLESLSIQSMLRFNVRNTPPIINSIKLHTQADMGSSKKHKQSTAPVPEFGLSTSINSTYRDTRNVINEWIKDGVKLSEIAILVPDEKAIDKARSICLDLGLEFKVINKDSYKFKDFQFIAISTFDDFKGLERPCISILGLDNYMIDREINDLELKRLLYSSMTRANYKIYVASGTILKEKRASVLKNNVFEDEQNE